MIRPLVASDLERVKQLQGELPWTFGRDFLGALAVVDENDVPVMAVGAWSRAEVHMLTDHTWATPEQRLRALAEVHEAMRLELEAQGVGEVHTWFEAAERFCGRLKRLGWKRLRKQMWGRTV